MKRAWALIAVGDELQYGGNRGYSDKIESQYRYDSAVANHRQLSTGDLILIRDRASVLGISIVQEIRRWDDRKIRQRCPDCRTTSIKQRANAIPRWRCGNGHVFDQPAANWEKVTAFEASYGRAYLPCVKPISSQRLKECAIRPNDQISIEEIDLVRIEADLLSSVPGCEKLLRKYLLHGSDLEHIHDDEFDPGMSAARRTELKAIKVRRGQRRFRDALISRYGPFCQVTGCDVMEIVEAAHIIPYVGYEHHHPMNGLLLRADIHTLFDLGIMGIEPLTLSIRFQDCVRDRAYTDLKGRRLATGTGSCSPSNEALNERWKAFVAGAASRQDHP